MELGRSELLQAYRTMKMIREFEERIHVEFATGEIPGFVHLYAGEEAIATGFGMHLDSRDKITSTHRGHGHCLAKGCDVYGMMAESMARKAACVGAREVRCTLRISPKACWAPTESSAAARHWRAGRHWRPRNSGTGGVAVAFVGDGGANQGTTLESLNLASIWKLPCIFVIENNGYAEATSSKYAGACRCLPNGQAVSTCRAWAWTGTTSSRSMKPHSRPSSAPATETDPPWSNAG